MGGCVPYHHPDDNRLSINFVTPDIDLAKENTETEESDVICSIEKYEFDRPVYVVYKGQKVPEVSPEEDFDIHDVVTEMDAADQIIATRILKLFQSVAEEKYEQEDERLTAYKQIEINKIPDALNHVTWDESVTRTGGELLSSLILRHALPNANHRTSLAMVSLYFQAISASFDMPTTTTEKYDWDGWVNEYIERSKRLLTVRRNVPRFNYLADAGCTVVERKDGLRIHLKEYDLSLRHRDALNAYADRHTQASVEFVREVLQKAGTPELRNGAPLSKQAFADQLQEME